MNGQETKVHVHVLPHFTVKIVRKLTLSYLSKKAIMIYSLFTRMTIKGILELVPQFGTNK